MEAAGGRAGVVAAGEGVAGWGRANGEATVGDGCAAVATARSQQPSSALLVAISQKHASVSNSGINNSGSGSRVRALAGWQQHRGVLCNPHRAHPASSSTAAPSWNGAVLPTRCSIKCQALVSLLGVVELSA